MPIVADAAVKIGADFSTFGRELEQGTTKPIQSLGQRIKGALSPQNLATAGVIGATAAFGALTAGLVGAAKSLIDIERLNAQTDAAIRSTGGAANISREQIEGLAEEMESLTTIERETVQEGANMLLTFTRVRNEVGAGNDIFNQATEAALDMSVALGTDATSAAMLLGKALNDPVKGMTAMTRAGIQFTDQQKEMIEAMVASGDLLGAQKIILAELETQFGGSAEAFANTTAGKIARFQNDVGNMFESIILGAVRVADAFGDTAESVGHGFDGIADVLGTEIVLWGDAAGEGRESVKAHLDLMPLDAQLAASAAARNVHGELVKGGPVIAAEAGKIAGMFASEISAIVESARTVGRDSVLALAQGIIEKQNDPLLAVEALKRVFEESLSEAEIIAELTGEETMRLFRQGLRSDIAADRLATREALQPVLDTLNSLGPAGRAAGLALMTQLGIGMRSAAPVGVRYARDAAGMITAVFPQSEPKDPQSPFRGITHWGADMMNTFASSIDGSGAAAALRDALGGVMPSLGGMGQMVGAGGAAGGGGVTYQLYVNGVPRTFESRDDFINALDDLGSFGDGRL